MAEREEDSDGAWDCAIGGDAQAMCLFCSGPDNAENGNLRLTKQLCFKTVCAPWKVFSPSGLSICEALLNRDIM